MEPGAKFAYSSLGFTLVGAALMRARLFAPLAITSGGFGAPGTAGKLDQPRGHRGPESVPIEPDGDRPDNILAIGPAESVHMTIADWAKFIALHLRGDPSNPQTRARLLQPETFATLHRPPLGGALGISNEGMRLWTSAVLRLLGR